VRQQEERVRVYLGGIGVLRTRTRDGEPGGRVGIWSASGAETWFDDLRIDDSEERRR
jgi:hypothetical protein